MYHYGSSEIFYNIKILFKQVNSWFGDKDKHF
jgi:hypothetical protein